MSVLPRTSRGRALSIYALSFSIPSIGPRLLRRSTMVAGVMLGVLLQVGCMTTPGTHDDKAPKTIGSQARTTLPPPPETIAPFNGKAHRLALGDPNIAQGMAAVGRRDALAADAAFRRADNPIAAFLLGMLYTDDVGLPPDPIEAVRRLQDSALAGYAPAQAALGDHYDHGTGVARDRDMANRWYRFAAAQGEEIATGRLAMAMIEGDGMPVDNKAALKLLNDCAVRQRGDDIYNPSGDDGGPSCQALLGVIYDEGRAGVTQNTATALAWYRLAAAQHMPLAEKRLADMYQQGRGVPADAAAEKFWRDRATADADKHPGSWTVQ